MKLVNRAVVIVTPKPPYYDWANRISPDTPLSPSEEAKENTATAFLLPTAGEFIEAHWAFVEAEYDEIFKAMLAECFTDPSLWPQPRTWVLFKDWFEVDIHDMVCDLGDGKIRRMKHSF